MRGIRNTVLGIALVGMLAAGSIRTAAALDFKASEFKAINMTDAGHETEAANAADPAEIEKSLAMFAAQNKDIAGLFSADDFRTAAARKYLEKIKYGSPETIAKINAYKKKLDAMQKHERNLNLLKSVLVSPKQFPHLYRLALKASKALELSDNFHVFIQLSADFNAYTYSYKQDDYDVVIYAPAVEMLTDDAMLALLGHEMGHVKDRAILNGLILAADFEARNTSTNAATHSPFYDKVFNELPPSLRGSLAASALELVSEKATIESFENSAQASDFQRNCELTADRAAAIVTGDAQAPLALLSTLAYGSKALSSEFNVEELIKQVRSVLATSASLEEVDSIASEQGSHPFSVLRLVEVSDYAASKPFSSLKARLNQNAFGKEIEIFTRIVEGTAIMASSYKKYLEEKADTDDTLVRLKTKDSFTSQLSRYGKGFSQLGLQIFAQIAASPLAAPNDALFDQLIAKIKADKEDIIKGLLAPSVADLLKKKIEAAKQVDEQTELKAKLKQIQDLADTKDTKPDTKPESGSDR
ncbi:MAG: M48 family metallopeptidase [Deltaproteobacteria bacterium]|nr:M48 family metallopeptidase [Deltaproteobacteria bacterium]